MDAVLEQGMRAVHALWRSLSAWDSSTGLIYIYVGFAIYLGLAALRGRGAVGGRLRDAVAAIVDRRIWGHRSARVDYGFLLVNSAVYTLAFTPFVLSPDWVEARAGALFGPREGPFGLAWQGWPVDLAYTAVVLLAFDFGVFLAHYLKHRVPLFWEFHKVHHSAEVLTPITLLRQHPVDQLVTGFITGITLGLANLAFHLLFAAPPALLTVLGVNAGLFAFYLLGYNLRHSHLWLCYGPFWSRVFISPAQHQIHHSVDPRHYDANFGYILAIWDRLFGSLYVPAGRESLRFGLADGESAEFGSVWRLYWQPLRAIAGWRPRGGRTRRERTRERA